MNFAREANKIFFYVSGLVRLGVAAKFHLILFMLYIGKYISMEYISSWIDDVE